MSTSAYISHICPLASFACTLRSKALSFQLRVSTHSPLHSSLRCRRPPPMSSDYAGTNFPANKLEPIQLNDESDFYQITSPDGFISISGFGSLLSENSARSTFPNLINFRVAKLRGFRRVFAHVAPIFFERGIAKPETKEISSLSVEPCEGETLIVTVFEIKKSEIPAFIKREHEFRFLAVLPETLDGKPFTNRAEAKRYIFIIMGDTTLIRFGGMISYLAVFIFGIVCWQPRILEMKLTTTFWITPFLETAKQPSVNTWQQLEQASWKRHLQNPSRLATVGNCNRKG
ncbi:hypothetical protein KPL71_027739 [Citrus sinensis]|uniref:Uncharacterized protein n=1 Tax=Citrus sinensis TaxID=2711 RepID=A0ACB8I972_CITSI|nr:hypothetical protein KPL71_027739 [Citrus sinensis]